MKVIYSNANLPVKHWDAHNWKDHHHSTTAKSVGKTDAHLKLKYTELLSHRQQKYKLKKINIHLLFIIM